MTEFKGIHILVHRLTYSDVIQHFSYEQMLDVNSHWASKFDLCLVVLFVRIIFCPFSLVLIFTSKIILYNNLYAHHYTNGFKYRYLTQFRYLILLPARIWTAIIRVRLFSCKQMCLQPPL